MNSTRQDIIKDIIRNFKLITKDSFVDDFQKPHRPPWGASSSYTSSDCISITSKFILHLNKIINDQEYLELIPSPKLQDLLKSSSDLVTYLEQPDGKSHRKNVLQKIEVINDFLLSNNIITLLRIPKDITEWENKHAEIAHIQRLLDNKNQINDAIESMKQWLNKRNEHDRVILEDSASVFHNRAKEFTSFNWFNGSKVIGGTWLLSFLFVFLGTIGVTIFILYYNIKAEYLFINLPLVLLGLFFLSQYIYAKKMYNAYLFRDSIITIMSELIKTNSEFHKQILEKAINTMFLEPTASPNFKLNNQLIDLINTITKLQKKD